MTWGPYYFFYICPECGKKYRWMLSYMSDADFSECPDCHISGKLVGETKDIQQGEERFAEYEDV